MCCCLSMGTRKRFAHMFGPTTSGRIDAQYHGARNHFRLLEAMNQPYGPAGREHERAQPGGPTVPSNDGVEATASGAQVESRRRN